MTSSCIGEWSSLTSSSEWNRTKRTQISVGLAIIFTDDSKVTSDHQATICTRANSSLILLSYITISFFNSYFYAGDIINIVIVDVSGVLTLKHQGTPWGVITFWSTPWLVVLVATHQAASTHMLTFTGCFKFLSPVDSLTKARDAELWRFLWSAPEQTVEQTIETPINWDAIALIMTSMYWIWQWQFYASSLFREALQLMTQYIGIHNINLIIQGERCWFLFEPLKCNSVFIQIPKFVICVPADALAPLGSRSSASTMLTIDLDIFLPIKFHRSSSVLTTPFLTRWRHSKWRMRSRIISRHIACFWLSPN